MTTTRRGVIATSAKDIVDVLRGSLILLTIFGGFIGILAIPVYLTATFVAELGGPAWLTIATSVGLGSAELYTLVLIPRYLGRHHDRDAS